MLGRLIFIGLFAASATAGGFGAKWLGTADVCSADPCPEADIAAVSTPDATEFVKLGNQFVVSIVRDDTVDAVVVLSLSVEIPEGQRDVVFAKEPRLRSEFLKVLFEHAQVGGFDGQFTASGRMERLRRGLLQAAKAELEESVLDVLITEIARQEIG